MSNPIRVAAALGLIALTWLSVLRDTRPPRPLPATAADTAFSAERAMRDVEEIAARPHPLGSPAHDEVRDYIMGRLTALGLAPRLQTTTGVSTRFPVAGRVQNILAWIPGTTPNGKAVLLVAHYDGVAASPAAGDNGASVAAILETVRAIRASKRPLAHDVFILFTDGEEAGLLGAAAFVREHPWAKDVGAVLNFDTRGTSGRSYMFETGAGNLSMVRALRSAGDVSAGSVFTTIYRTLPNDTDLSELMHLGVPAMNFAFAGGVLRYHTAHDDVAHLDPASVQHQGAQMLAVTRTLANGTLPLARTGDAVFFDFPFLGLIVYPQWLALPLALAALVLVGLVIVRTPSRVAMGFAIVFGAVFASTALALLVAAHGPRAWSGWTAAPVVAFALALNAAVLALARRKVDAPSLHAGALALWALVAIVVTLLAPGAGYLFTWPLLFAAVAARSRSAIPQWVAAIVALTMLAGFSYAIAVVMLGVSGVGAAQLAFFTAMLGWLLLPLLEPLAGEAPFAGALRLGAVGALCAVISLSAIHPSPALPTPSNLAYLENADSSAAWLGVTGVANDWSQSVVGTPRAGPAWNPLPGRAAPRVPLAAPTATLILDTLIDAHRRAIIRVNAPHALALVMHIVGAPVSRTAIDARVVDTTHYRVRSRGQAWAMQFWGVPDSGAVISVAVPPGASFDLELAARHSGIPALPGIGIPPRPPWVVPIGDGDVNVVYRRFHF